MSILKELYTPVCALDLSYEEHGDGELRHSPETCAFRKAVEKALSCKTSWRDNDSAWVYREDDNYTLGYIGYSDRSYSGDGLDLKYNVVSKNIVNNKYSSGQSNHHMSSALHMDKAVKNAQRYLRPWSPVEHIDISFSGFRRDWNDVQYQADNEYSNKLNSLTKDIANRGDAFKELGHLLKSGYTFLYPSVRVLIEEIHEALAEKNEVKQRPKLHKFIYIREYFGEEQAAKFQVNADDYWFDLKKYQADHKQIQWIKSDDLTEDEKRKISSLSFGDNGFYVDGVGYKAASNCYYIVPEENWKPDHTIS